MSDGITFAIEGSAAVEAAEALLAIEGLSGGLEAEDGVSRDGGLTAIATIICNHSRHHWRHHSPR